MVSIAACMYVCKGIKQYILYIGLRIKIGAVHTPHI